MSVIDNIRLTFLYIEFYSMGKTWVYPESYIPYNIFRYIVKGKAEFCIDGEEIIVKENQIVYIPQGCRMSCRALSESFEFYSLRFTTSVFYEGEDVLKEYYGIPRIIENEGEDYYFKEICKWVKKDSWVKKCFVRGYLDLLIGTLSTGIAIVISSMAAYGIVRFFPKLGSIMSKVLVATYMFPPILLDDYLELCAGK